MNDPLNPNPTNVFFLNSTKFFQENETLHVKIGQKLTLWEHFSPLSYDDLLKIQAENHRQIIQELSSEEEDEEVEASSEDIKRILANWNEMQEFIERYHKDKIDSASLIDGVNERIMHQFRMTLYRRRHQVSIKKFFSPKDKASPSKKQESEATQEVVEVVDLPALDMESE